MEPTDFTKIEFQHENHSYYYNGKPLIPVTTLVKSVTPPFQKEKVSLSVARRDGKSQEQVLKEWEFNGQQAMDKGNRTHSYAEDVIAGCRDVILRSVNDRIPEWDAMDCAWGKMQQGLNATLIEKELMVGDAEFGVAGRIDAILEINVKPGKAIFDWKTGKYFTKSPFGPMLAPFEDLPNCEHSKYSIQQSMYRLIYERNTGEELCDSFMLHLRKDGTHELHRAIDLRERLADWLVDGVPSAICGDPEQERHVSGLIGLMTHFDLEKLSIQTIQNLGMACRKLADNTVDFLADDSDF